MAEVQFTGGSNKTYYRIDSEGKLFRLAKQGETGTYEHVKGDKAGTKKGEIEVRKNVMAIQGFIKDLYVHNSQYGDSLIIDIIDNDGIISVIALPLDSSFYDDFVRKLPNIKEGKEYLFSSFKMQKKDQNTGKLIEGFVYGMYIKAVSDGVKIERWFNKETIGKMEAVDEAMLKSLGKDYWRIYFTLVGNKFKTVVVPKAKKRFLDYWDANNVPNPINAEKEQSDNDFADVLQAPQRDIYTAPVSNAQPTSFNDDSSFPSLADEPPVMEEDNSLPF